MSQKWTLRLGNDLRDSGEMRGFLGKPYTCANDCLHTRTLLNSRAFRCIAYMYFVLYNFNQLFNYINLLLQ